MYPNEIHWDGKTENSWTERVSEMDAVVHATGYGLEHWPWTAAQKRRFHESRVIPGRLLAAAVVNARPRPKVFLQISGINHYGLMGATAADEATPAATDFLAELTVDWEGATEPVERAGVRRIVARSAVILGARGGLLSLMALPVRLFLGGRLGDGKQAFCWIHEADHKAALQFLLVSEDAAGAYNLIAPTQTSNQHFMKALAAELHRPCWLPMPAFLLHGLLGEMSVLVVAGRFARPRRLLEMGFNFQFPAIEGALQDLFHWT